MLGLAVLPDAAGFRHKLCERVSVVSGPLNVEEGDPEVVGRLLDLTCRLISELLRLSLVTAGIFGLREDLLDVSTRLPVLPALAVLQKSSDRTMEQRLSSVPLILARHEGAMVSLPIPSLPGSKAKR